MKKTLLIVAVAGLAFASCKKDYTCKCTTTDSSGNIATFSQNTTIHATKSDATTACNSMNSTVSTVTHACSIQ